HRINPWVPEPFQAVRPHTTPVSSLVYQDQSMPSLIELDVRSLFDSLRMSQSVRGQDVLGPREQLFGSENHFYTKSTAGTLIQTQNFKYKSPYTFRMSRRGFVAFQFTILGSYYRTLSYNAN